MRVAAAILSAFVGLASTSAALAVSQDCHVGSYGLSDGSAVDIGPSEADTLRWRMFSGETGQLHPNKGGTWTSTFGWTGRPDGKAVSFSDCANGHIVFDTMSGHRIAFDAGDTTFDSHGTKLVGRLVMPKGNGKVPVVILVHGSEHDSAVDFYSLQRMFPAHGIGAFVYDKRGTGASAGAYTQDFDTLADDLVVATQEARRLAGARAGRVGYRAAARVAGSRRWRRAGRRSISSSSALALP